MENKGERRVVRSWTSCSESTPAQPIQMVEKSGKGVGREILVEGVGVGVNGGDDGGVGGCDAEGRLSQLESAKPTELRCLGWWVFVDLGE